VFQDEGVEHGGVAIFEMGEVDVFFDILVFRMELSETSKFVNGGIECGWD
jgi:hypothetical protein